MRTVKRTIALLMAAVLLLAAALFAQLTGLDTGVQAQAVNDSVYLAYYADVIKEYQTAFKYNLDPDRIPSGLSLDLVNWNLMYYQPDDLTPDTLCYALYDVNGNGFPELFIGHQWINGYGNKEWLLYGAYCYTNKINRIGECTSWGYRMWGSVFKTGVIGETASIGDVFWGFYKLNKNDQVRMIDCIELARSSGVEQYRHGDNYNINITKRQANQLCKKYTGCSALDKMQSNVKMQWKPMKDIGTVNSLAAPSGLKVSSANTTALNLRWNKIKGVKGYQVFRYDAAAKKYVRVAVTRRNVAKVTDLAPGTSYRFVVRAYSKAGGKYLYSGYSNALTAQTR